MSYMKKYSSGAGISAVVLRDSISASNVRLTTFEIELPRFILSELNTHRMLSKNSASSRAIPSDTFIKMIEDSPATFVFWGKNQAGMSAKEELGPVEKEMAQKTWLDACKSMINFNKILDKIGLHKQSKNRLLESFMTQKTVISGTEWANFFWLRDHPDAQPEIQVLAQLMKDALDASNPFFLQPGELHVPYVSIARDENGDLKYLDSDNKELTEEEAIKISVSCAAQVSYRKLDETKDKSIAIYDRLINMKPAHASPTEHVGSPMAPNASQFNPATWENGVTHVDRKGELWSGNFRQWVQFRKVIPNEAVW